MARASYLVPSEVVSVGEVPVVDEDLSVEAGAPGHADGNVRVVAVAVKLSRGHRIAEVGVVVVGGALAGLVLVPHVGQALGEDLSWRGENLVFTPGYKRFKQLS